MHIIFNEDHYLDNTSVPIDLNQEPADLVILSFSDSDLNAFANAWDLLEVSNIGHTD